MHPSENENNSASKQSLSDYFEHMQDSASRSNCGDLEPLDLNATNVSSA